MKSRIIDFLVRENITPAEFADKIGVQRSSVSHILSGRNFPSASFIQKMLTVYTDLNPRWLLLGSGVMFIQKNSPLEQPSLFSLNEIENFQSNKEAINNDQNPVRKKDPGNGGKKIKSIKSQSDHFNVAEGFNTESNLVRSINETNKQIDKIVIFFRDKTFSIYSPSL